MNTLLADSDTLPWYRQFWPWFLILLPATVVVAGLGTLYIANRHADDLVADDYYKEGLAINRRIERSQRAAALGIDAAFSVSERRVTVTTDGPVSTAALKLTLAHPLEADRDVTVTLHRTATNVFTAGLPVTPELHWHWAIEDDAGQWRIDGMLGADDFPHGHGN